MVTSGFYGYHGYQWLPVVFYGYQRLCIWSPETVDGYQWFLWLSWLSVVISGFLWLPEAVYGHQRL